MFKSLVYKEWIKTRWFLLILTLLGLLAVGNVFLKLQHNITFNEANKYWYMILFQNIIFYKSLKFVPLVIGVLIAIVQYVPEITNKRMKLTFHLPINENKILMMMLAYGTIMLLLCYILLFLLYIGLGNTMLPKEIMQASLSSIFPWFMAGFAAYFLGALITLEVIWKYRIAYFLAASAFILFYFESGLSGSYALINGKLVILTLLLSISLTFSAYRFRKGEM